jgi:hypothetical protein
MKTLETLYKEYAALEAEYQDALNSFSTTIKGASR